MIDYKSDMTVGHWQYWRELLAELRAEELRSGQSEAELVQGAAEQAELAAIENKPQEMN